MGTDLMALVDEYIVFWAKNLQRIGDESDVYGATLITISGVEIPSLCDRKADSEGWYRIVAPTSWGPIFAASIDDGIRSERYSDGVIDYWCKRTVMSPLRNWLEKKEEQSGL